MSTPTTDLALLRRFEPVLRFTRGEQFFPMDIEPYVRASSLWVQRPDESPQKLVAEGELDLDRLARPCADEFGAVHFLKFAEPLSPIELATYYDLRARRDGSEQAVFHAGPGRLARVGYTSRFIDALFSISLLARGRVPGDLAAAAALNYQQMQKVHEHYTYHGRVVRQNGWIVLQYWFFYPFNNWRSGFFGANDHEADWEMICVYLAQDELLGEIYPAWVAYASHDYQGDDLRRRWDDPEVQKVGEHPVIYVGAGSHASYYSPGEYLTEITVSFLHPLLRLLEGVQRFWRQQLRQYGGDETHPDLVEVSNIFRIPFVDYARGDGLTLGPGQEKEWSQPHSIDPAPPWVSSYRGLWGLYTRDRFAGEDAPAGPMFNRNGSVRRAWYDPVGWAGLDKLAPPDDTLNQVLAEKAAICERQTMLRATVDEKARELQSLGVQAAAMHTQPHLFKLYTAHQQRIEALGKEVDNLRAQIATDQALVEALTFYADQVRAGDLGPPRAHIQRAHRPASAARLRWSRLAEVWAAASISLMLIIFVMLVYFGGQYLMVGLVSTIALFTFIEAGFRGRLIGLVTSLTIALAVVAALVIIYEFFWSLVVAGVVLAGLYILWENLRELWN